jgi:predicted P-loop ATPase/GTPase
VTILVAGADRVDAGKTTFATGLAAFLGTTAFKPRAGNDYWFHHDDVRHAVEQGRLFGNDASRLADASPGALAPEDLNPVHRLWRPSPGPETGLLGKPDREFVVDRVGETFVVNDAVTVPETVAERLPLDDAVRVDSLSAFNEVMRPRHLVVLDALAKRIADHDRPVVESYGDVARPLREVEPAAVAVVEPARVRVYDGERYVRACRVAGGGPEVGRLEERVPAVVEHLDPVERLSLPALSSDERADPNAVADAFAEAYRALEAVADGAPDR